jgi:hypothetical protein
VTGTRIRTLTRTWKWKTDTDKDMDMDMDIQMLMDGTFFTCGFIAQWNEITPIIRRAQVRDYRGMNVKVLYKFIFLCVTDKVYF